ncbi:MAG: hypothetical protein RJA70_2381 [Pseudomonadota bacterium]|jgi:GTP cyclohydrolase I
MTLFDVQSSADSREVPINRVGVKGVRHPLRVRGRDGKVQATVCSANLYVALEHNVKGTHMSRFIEILHELNEPIDQASFADLVRLVADRLQAKSSYVELRFPYFVMKKAPVSQVESMLDYEVSYIGEWSEGVPQVGIWVQIPVTSLCPCSKKISDYGAHNQRSHITLHVEVNAPVHLEELIEMAEKSASMELYGILKRPDEKYVTEKAYENAKFVEDMIRDLALALASDSRVVRFSVEVENFESIHNHSAYAWIKQDKLSPSPALAQGR